MLEMPRAVIVRILDDSGRPVAGARLLAVADYSKLLAKDARAAVSDAMGKVEIGRLEVPRDSAPWLLASHPGFMPTLVKPTDPRWNDALATVATATIDLTIQLHAPQYLRVEVSDRRGRRIEGAAVSAYADRGREVELLVERGVDSSELLMRSAPSGVTDASGAVVLPTSRDISYELVASKFGFCESTAVLNVDQVRGDRVSMTLDAIVVGGVKVPEFDGFSPSVGAYSERGGLSDAEGGLRRADLPGEMLRALEAHVEKRLEVKNVQWHFAIEADPSTYPVRVPIGFRALPGDPFFKGEMRLKLLDELQLSDILMPPDTNCRKLVEVHVEFVDASDAPTLPDETLWAITDVSRRHWRIAKQLPAEDRADPAAGRQSYRFRLPPGEYLVLPQIGMARTQPIVVEETKFTVLVDRPEVVRVRARTPQTGTANICAVDELGRAVRFGRVVITSDAGGVLSIVDPTSEKFVFTGVLGNYTAKWVTKGKGASDEFAFEFSTVGQVTELKLTIVDSNEGYVDE